MINDRLKAKLIQLMEIDASSIQFANAYHKAHPEFDAGNFVRAVETQDTEALKQVVDQYGWPGASLVGEEGVTAAWLIAQHSDHDVAFQRQCWELMCRAVSLGEAKPGYLAFLTDRLLVNEG